MAANVPDGGYGWVVVAASFCAHMLSFGITLTVGVFYVVFLEKFDGQVGAIALISSLNTACCLGTGEECWQYYLVPININIITLSFFTCKPVWTVLAAVGRRYL